MSYSLLERERVKVLHERSLFVASEYNLWLFHERSLCSDNLLELLFFVSWLVSFLRVTFRSGAQYWMRLFIIKVFLYLVCMKYGYS